MSRGRFVWYDLMSQDPERSKVFYTQVAGWTLQKFGDDGVYTMFANEKGPLGGVAPLSDAATKAGAPTHWLAYVAVPDVDAAAATVVELGGTILVPATDLSGAGRYVVFKSPHGAVISAFRGQGYDETATDKAMHDGEFVWAEYMGDAPEAELSFYNALFGWTETHRHDMDTGPYILYGRPGGRTLGGFFQKPAVVPVSHWMHYIAVDDIATALERAIKAGGTVLNGPMQVPGGGWVAQLDDDLGCAFAMTSAVNSKK